MPQLLVRLANGTFYFGPANGSTQGGTKIPSWGQRTAGDFNTAPDPSFIGYAIQDVFIHRNRLGLLADENVILSRAKSFFDFFPETVSTVLDTDPIDLSASSNRVSVLRYAVPNQDELILFSDQLQFRLSSDAAGLTPASATVSVVTAFEADTTVRPLQAPSGIVFAQTNGSWTQFREFSVRGAGTALIGSAPSLTDHCPTFIPAGVTQLAGNDTAGVWFAISKTAGNLDRIYAYKYSDRGGANGGRAPSPGELALERGDVRLLLHGERARPGDGLARVCEGARGQARALAGTGGRAGARRARARAAAREEARR
jgi:hypothetical protein